MYWGEIAALGTAVCWSFTAYGKETQGGPGDPVDADFILPWVTEDFDWGGERTTETTEPVEGWPWVVKEIGTIEPGETVCWETYARAYSWSAGHTVVIVARIESPDFGVVELTFEVQVINAP